LRRWRAPGSGRSRVSRSRSGPRPSCAEDQNLERGDTIMLKTAFAIRNEAYEIVQPDQIQPADTLIPRRRLNELLGCEAALRAYTRGAGFVSIERAEYDGLLAAAGERETMREELDQARRARDLMAAAALNMARKYAQAQREIDRLRERLRRPAPSDCAAA